VLPVLQNRQVPSQGEIAPMPLVTYNKPPLGQIDSRAVLLKKMPPWFAVRPIALR
jgi:hypothetical protein